MESSRFALGESFLDCDTMVALSNEEALSFFLSKKQIDKILNNRKVVENVIKKNIPIYGINTGFGFLSQVVIEKGKQKELQKNLIHSHACGVGDVLTKEQTKGLLMVRAHTLAKGFSGVRKECIDIILKCLECDYIPVVPVQGSVGASGDLAPLAHLALPLIGAGKVYYKDRILPAQEAMKHSGFKPFTPHEKEGLSLINGTCFMAAVGGFNVVESGALLKSADIISAFSLVSFLGLSDAFSEDLHQCRLLEGQKTSALNIRNILEGYQNTASFDRVQDPYSFRCIPQVHGASRDVWSFVKSTVEKELNSVTDNPIVISEDNILSGGNFHGQALAMAMDFLAISVAELGSISERRIEKLTNPNMNKGLPPFIIENSGVNSGFMIPHVVAASLVAENKIYSHPASVDSIPTSADQEDHVSMGATATIKVGKIIKNVSHILAIELLAAAQSFELRKLKKAPAAICEIHSWVRSHSDFMSKDRSLSDDIEVIAKHILDSKLVSILPSFVELQ